MKVLLLCNKSPWPPKEGGPIAMYAMIQGLLLTGNTVKVLALNTNKYVVDENEIPLDFRQQTKITFVNVDLTFKPVDAFLNLFTNQSFHIKRFISPEITAALTDILNKETFDIIQFESLFLTSYISLIKRLSTAVLVLRAHNIEHLIWLRLVQETKQPLKRFYLKHLAKTLQAYEVAVLNKLDGIATITFNDEERIRRLGCTSYIGTIPLGVSSTDFLPDKNSPQVKTLFYIGSMNWLPNQEGIRWFLKECWPLIKEKFPEIKFVLAGRNMPKWMLNNSISGVEIKGEVPDARQFISENGIMIVPLFSGSGIRIKIIEAMAQGKTVITTTLGAEGIMSQNQKNILIANTPEDFLRVICSCYLEPGMTKQIGENARQYILENHLLEKVSVITKKYYQRLIQSLN